MATPADLRSLLDLFEKRGQLQRIRVPVDPHLEIAEIHRRIVTQGGPALLFEQVKSSRFRVTTNLFGTLERVQWAFGSHFPQTLEQLANTITHPPSTSWQWLRHLNAMKGNLFKLLRTGLASSRSSPLLHHTDLNLDDLPFLTSWPLDGGPFLTLPLVYTSSSGHNGKSANLGMYRIQRFDAQHAGLHFQIGKGAGFHLWQAEQAQIDMPVSIFLGGPPSLIASAVAPLPENINELLLASALLGHRLPRYHDPSWPHPLIRDAEFAILGRAQCHKRRLEGPFGDHYGYYSLAHDFPYMKVERVMARKDAIYPATIVGKPPQEDLFLGKWLQQMLKPIIRLAMPGVLDLWSYGESGFHALAAARVHERYEREALAHALRILGEGQLALTKFLLITDQEIDLTDIRATLSCILERFVPSRDIYILANLSLDTLDYTGPSLNKGSRGIFVGLGKPKRQLLSQWEGSLCHPFRRAAAFCPGCLLVEGPSYESDPKAAQELTHERLNKWPLIILVDAIDESITAHQFLWSVFLRFEPARDIYSRHEFHHYHCAHELPIVIDARTKPSYPPVVEVDDTTRELVDRRWKEYFP